MAPAGLGSLEHTFKLPAASPALDEHRLTSASQQYSCTQDGHSWGPVVFCALEILLQVFTQMQNSEDHRFRMNSTP